MKTLVLALLFMFITSSCAAQGCYTLRDDPLRVEAALQSTVGFVELRDEPDEEHGRWNRPYCSGAWISPTVLVSATHCFEDEETVELFPGVTVTVPVETDYVGKKVSFVRYGQVNDDGKVTSRPSTAMIVWASEEQDVTILKLVQGHPNRNWFNLSPREARVGETAYAIGMPVTLTWNFTTGIITRVWHRTTGIHTLYTTQVVSYFGSSGGPLFSESGELLGICHSLSGGQSSITHWVGVPEIRKGLKASHVHLH